MASGTIKGTFSGTSQSNIYPEMRWTSTPNTSTNSSSVTVKLFFVRANAAWGSYNLTGFKPTIKIDTNSASATGKTFDLRNKPEQEIWSRTMTVTHNSAGGKSLFLGTSGVTGLSSLGSFNFAQTVQLDIIPRAYTVDKSEATVAMGSNFTFKVNDNGSGFSTKSYFNFGSAKLDLGSPTPGQNKTFLVDPAVFAPAIPSANSGWGTLHLETWNGNTLIGDATIKITLTIPATILPTVGTVTVSDISDVPTKLGVSGVYLQGLSNLQFAISASGIYGSSITSYKITNGGQSVSGKTPLNFDLSSRNIGSGAKTFVVEVTDTRGRKATKNVDITITPYALPSITQLAVVRDTINPATIIINKNGTVTSIKVSGAEKNNYTAVTEYRLQGSDTWETASEESGEFQNTSITETQIDKSYEIRVTLTDSFASISSLAIVTTANYLLSYYRDEGIGVNKLFEPGHGVLDVNGMIWMNNRSLTDTFVEKTDTGWIDLAFTSQFGKFDGKKCRYRVKNGKVELWGQASPIVDIPYSSDGIPMFTNFPSEYLPTEEITVVCQGSSNTVWILRLIPNSGIKFARYRNGSTNGTAAAGVWLPFHKIYSLD